MCFQAILYMPSQLLPFVWQNSITLGGGSVNRSLPERRNTFKFIMSTIELGISLIWLYLRESISKFFKFPIEEGIDPLSWLFPRDSISKFFKFPIEEGIDPLNWLLER